MGPSIANMYATIIICIYMAFKFTELVTFPTIYQWLEIHGFFIYLLLVSDIYLVYLLWYVLRGSHPTNESKKIKVIGNLKVDNITFRDLVWGQIT